MLDNIRWERYAQARAMGQTNVEAAKAAGFRCKNNENYKMSGDRCYARPEVRARIQELLESQWEKAERRITYTRDDIVAELWDNLKRAKEAGDRGLGAANKTLELLGLEMAMFERRSTQKIQRIDPLEGMEDHQLLEYISRAFHELGMEVDIGLIAQGLRLEGSSFEPREESERPALPAAADVSPLPQTEGVSLARRPEERTSPDGGESAWEDT